MHEPGDLAPAAEQPSWAWTSAGMRTSRIGPGFAAASSVAVSAFHGFPADLGGGGYDRQAFLLPPQSESFIVTVAQKPGAAQFTTIAAAIAAAAGKAQALISILDSASYAETLSVTLGAGESLAIEAADLTRPHLHLATPLTISGPADAMLTLSGLLIEGAVTVSGALGRLRVLHSTLAPGLAIGAAKTRIAVAVGRGAGRRQPLDLEFIFSITGPLNVADVEGSRIWLLDSVLDGAGGAAIGAAGYPPVNGPALWIERSTVFGPFFLRQIDSATESCSPAW